MTKSLTRVCLSVSLFAAACGSNSNTNLQGGGAVHGTDAGADSAPSGSGGETSGSGGAVGSGGATSSGGSVVSSGGSTASDAGKPTGSDDGGALSPDAAAPPATCRNSADCANVDGKSICDAATGKCIACHTNSDCSAKQECTNAVCTNLPKCGSSLDCSSAPGGKTICDKPNGVCVQCKIDADCGDNAVCTDRVCHVGCDSDNDCTAKHMLCNKGIGFSNECTQCIVDKDCKSNQYCDSSGACVPQTCKPAQQSCEGDLVVECNTAGSDVGPVNDCTLLLLTSCLVDGDNAKCVSPCENHKKGGLETDVDCGGPSCQRCSSGKGCVLGTDCSSGKCTSSKCE